MKTGRKINDQINESNLFNYQFNEFDSKLIFSIEKDFANYFDGIPCCLVTVDVLNIINAITWCLELVWNVTLRFYVFSDFKFIK